jgi:hypothetical protein
MYEKTHKSANFIYELYDLNDKKVYRFDTDCELNDGYFIDKNNFILNVEKAIATFNISGGEILALSMASDAVFDSDGKKLEH